MHASSRHRTTAHAWAFSPPGFNPAGWHPGELASGARVVLRGPLARGALVWARGQRGRPFQVRFRGFRPRVGFGADPTTRSILRAPLPATGWRLSSAFGLRKAPAGKYKGLTRDHNGLDLAAPEGTPVYAVADGTVTDQWFAGVGKGAINGNALRIDHDLPDVRATAYLHLSKALVSKGARVSAGQLVGLVGRTGQATGPHLHWIVYGESGPIDPLPYLNAARQPSLPQRAAGSAVANWHVLAAMASAGLLAGLMWWARRRRVPALAPAPAAVPVLVPALANPSRSRAWRSPWH